MLKGKTAIGTGHSRGIGKAIGRGFKKTWVRARKHIRKGIGTKYYVNRCLIRARKAQNANKGAEEMLEIVGDEATIYAMDFIELWPNKNNTPKRKQIREIMEIMENQLNFQESRRTKPSRLYGKIREAANAYNDRDRIKQNAKAQISRILKSPYLRLGFFAERGRMKDKMRRALRRNGIKIVS